MKWFRDPNLKFLRSLAFLVLVAIVTAYAVMHAWAVDPKASVEKEGNAVSAALVYLVALGIIGLYSAYNALEIFKGKVEFGKQLVEGLSKIQEVRESAVTKYDSLNVPVARLREELLSGNRAIQHDLDRFMYYYYLNHWIPDYVWDAKNRILVMAAFTWFAENGNGDDIEMLSRCREKIEDKDEELIEVAARAINHLRNFLPPGLKRV